MQSEEDWTPRAIPAQSAEPAGENSAAPEGTTPERPRRIPRGRRPKRQADAAVAPEAEKETQATSTQEAPVPAKRWEKVAAETSPAYEEATEPATEVRRISETVPVAHQTPIERPQPSASEPEGNESDSAEEREGGENAEEARFQQQQPQQHDGRDFRPRHQGGGKPFHSRHQHQPDKDFRGKKSKKKKKKWMGASPVQTVDTPIGDLPDQGRFQEIETLAQQAAGFTGEPLQLDSLYDLTLHDLAAGARAMGIHLDAAPNRRVLIEQMMRKAHEDCRPIIDRGAIEITEKNHGFITRRAHNYHCEPESPYVAASFVRRYGLRKGQLIEAQVRPAEGNERCPAVIKLNKVMGREPGEVADITPFEDLVPYYPTRRILLELTGQEATKDVSMRAVDLLTPIGFGQRGLIVAPPRTGKTIILQQIANSVARNNPEAHLIVLLVDERPEEVTDFRRNVRGEVVSSTFDEAADSHVEVAEMVIEKARRMVEVGEHVVILLDSITRLARAYNTMMPSSGKILSGGVEANALQKPKRFFGAARNIEGGGSLTILATALIDTGSRMDEVIFEEFKGTGNMEVHLDRALVDKRIFPALNIEKSGTRKEELLYHPDEMSRIYSLRRAIQGVPIIDAMEMLVQRLKKTRSNAEFLMAMNR